MHHALLRLGTYIDIPGSIQHECSNPSQVRRGSRARARRSAAAAGGGALLRAPLLPDDLLEQRDVVAVAGQAGGDLAADRRAEEVEVADDVEDLVADELVGE